MDALLKSMLFGLLFVTTLIVSAVFFNEDQKEIDVVEEEAVKLNDEKNLIAFTYSEWADYPSEILVG